MALGSLSGLGKVPELRRRLLYTLILMAIYRLGIFISVPGVDRSILLQYMKFGGGGFFGLFDMFSGGAVSQLSVFALGVMPYISAQIILELLASVVPSLDRLKKEQGGGMQKFNQYARYLTIALCLIQGTGIALWLESLNAQAGTEGVIRTTGFIFRFVTIMSLTSGAMLLMWMGERITERGVGNGISLIIFAGIVARLPQAFGQTLSLSTFEGGRLEPLTLLIILILVIAVIIVIVFFESAQRRIPVQYAKKVVGRKIYEGRTTYLPLKVNTAGVIPPIFASSVLMFPSMLGNLFPGAGWVQWIQRVLVPGHMLYNLIYVLMIIFFCFFYTAVTFNPFDVADNLKKGGGFVPGIRAGKATAEYIDKVLSRITFGGAIYVALVCVLPTFLQSQFGVPFYFGGTSLLIVVGVAMDTASQIEAHLITQSYDGFSVGGGPKVRSRRSS